MYLLCLFARLLVSSENIDFADELPEIYELQPSTSSAWQKQMTNEDPLTNSEQNNDSYFSEVSSQHQFKFKNPDFYDLYDLEVDDSCMEIDLYSKCNSMINKNYQTQLHILISTNLQVQVIMKKALNHVLF